MLETMITQAVRYACDHCGTPPEGGWSQTTTESRAKMEKAGFIRHAWKEKGCWRELVLCAACFAALETRGEGKGQSG